MDWKDPEQRRAYYREKQREYRMRNSSLTKRKRHDNHIANRERDLQNNKAWYRRNKESQNLKQRAWTKAHPEKAREYAQRYRERHPDRVRTTTERLREYTRRNSRQWYKANRERHLANSRRWYRANHDRAVVKWANRRARMRYGSPDKMTVDQWKAIKKAYNNCCAYCGQPSKKLTQDHVIPLAKNGHHTASNIVPACRTCNLKKATNAPPTIPAKRLML